MRRAIVHWIATAAAGGAIGLSSCTTQRHVRADADAAAIGAEARLEQVRRPSFAVHRQAGVVVARQARLDHPTAATAATARDALQRAQRAARIAPGRYLYEVVFSDESIRFAPGSAALDDADRRALDAFARELEIRDDDVVIELQGHTDATGDERANRALGRARAEAVRHYLCQHHDVPRQRISVVSYGETAPLASNRTAAGRARNRRVTIVVLE